MKWKEWKGFISAKTTAV